MRSLLFILAFCGAAQPAAAQFTTTYAGTQTQGGTSVPATAQFAVEAGHVAAIMTGARGGRIVFDEKAQVLHLISDADKTYIDIDKSSAGRGDPMQMMQQQLDRMPPAQRAQAEQMMRSMTSAMPPPLTYVTSTEKKTIAGYECTRVDGMRGTDKVTEYLRIDVPRPGDDRRGASDHARHAELPPQFHDHGEERRRFDARVSVGHQRGRLPGAHPLLHERHDDARTHAPNREPEADPRRVVRGAEGLQEGRHVDPHRPGPLRDQMTRFSPAFVAGGSLVASALSCAMLSQSVSAERPPALARNAFQTASKLVTTAVTVREKDGRLVTNLGERDFVVDRRRPSAGVGALRVGAGPPQRGDRDRHEPEC